MGKKIQASGLEQAIVQELQEYASICADDMKEIVDEVAMETVADLKQTSPKKSGEYAKKWAQKLTEDKAVNRTRTVYVKKPDYRRSHLLERGHAKRGGGRTRAYPHVSPAERRAIRKLEERMKGRL